MNAITRRAVLATTTAAAIGARARAQPAPIELKVSHYLPPNHTTHKFLEAWGADLDKRSEGRLKLRLYPAGQLGPVPRQMDLARNGQADMAVGLTGATPGRYPMTELSSLPFVAPSAGDGSASTSRRLTELAPKYLASEYAGLRVLWMGVTPPNFFCTARREINTVADLRGLKMRFQGEQSAKILRAVGAVPLQVPPGDVADGMAKGVIDGSIFNFEGAESFGLGSVTHFVILPTFSNAVTPLVMNTARYEGLPPDLRALIDQTTGAEAAGRLGRNWDAADQHGREFMLAQKVSIKTLSAEETAKLKAALEPIVAEGIAEVAHAGKPAQAFVDAYRA